MRSHDSENLRHVRHRIRVCTCQFSSHKILQSSMLGTDADESPEKHSKAGSSGMDGRIGEVISRKDDRFQESIVEGWSNVQKAKRELRFGEVCPVPTRHVVYVKKRRVRNGAPSGNGHVDRAYPVSRRGGAPRRSQSTEQRSIKPGTLARQQKPQAGGAWALRHGSVELDLICSWRAFVFDEAP